MVAIAMHEKDRRNLRPARGGRGRLRKGGEAKIPGNQGQGSGTL
jgi:hypothetical protein